MIISLDSVLAVFLSFAVTAAVCPLLPGGITVTAEG